MEDKKLNEAIDMIENAGGFVMFPETDKDERNIRSQTFIEENSIMDDIDKEEEKYKNDYEERRNDAFEEFDEALKQKNFSYSDVEDICYENGIDMDDIEDYINSYY